MRIRTLRWNDSGHAILIEVDGVRLIHVPGVAEAPAGDVLDRIGLADVAFIAARTPAAVLNEVLAKLRPRVLVPIDHTGADDLAAFTATLDGRFTISRANGNTAAVTAGRGPTRERPSCIVLQAAARPMPEELSRLFAQMDAPLETARSIFSGLTPAQMNHRPSDGTHTPRWNAEHIMGRELGFFTAIYSRVDPALPHLDLNPAQMPPDYRPAHPDWDGDEEVRQIERAAALVRRFAYLLDGMDLDRRPQGSPWNIRNLCQTMHNHFSEHLANVKKKFELPDWPAAK